MMSETLDTVAPPTLRQRAAEAAEQQRQQKFASDSLTIERLLIKAGILSGAAHDALRFYHDKRGEARCDIEGVRFTIQTYYDYDEEGDGRPQREHTQLSANLICSTEGCTETAAFGSAHNIKALADLNDLYTQVETRVPEAWACYECRRGNTPDKRKTTDEELADLVF